MEKIGDTLQFRREFPFSSNLSIFGYTNIAQDCPTLISATISDFGDSLGPSLTVANLLTYLLNIFTIELPENI